MPAPHALILITLAAVVPHATAEAGVDPTSCVASVCASYDGESWGEGDCQSGNAGAYRGLALTHSDEESVTGAYLSESCWSESGERSGGAQATSFAVTRLEWETFQMDGIVIFWESGHHADDSWCGVTVIVHAPGIGTLVPAPCPGGLPPPRLLPALP